MENDVTNNHLLLTACGLEWGGWGPYVVHDHTIGPVHSWVDRITRLQSASVNLKGVAWGQLSRRTQQNDQLVPY